MAEVGDSPGRGAAFKRDWTQGSIIGNLCDLSWLMMITQSIMPGIGGCGKADEDKHRRQAFPRQS